MGVNSIEWHKECLGNHRETLSRELRDLEGRIERFNRSKDECTAYAEQIARAVETGKTSFDRDKFGKPRKVNNAHD